MCFCSQGTDKDTLIEPNGSMSFTFTRIIFKTTRQTCFMKATKFGD